MSETFIDEGKKYQLMEGFFNFYLDKSVSKENLDLLKWFYKNVGFTSKISDETLNLLDEVKEQEELVEVLLNNIYPELLTQYTNNKK